MGMGVVGGLGLEGMNAGAHGNGLDAFGRRHSIAVTDLRNGGAENGGGRDRGDRKGKSEGEWDSVSEGSLMNLPVGGFWRI